MTIPAQSKVRIITGACTGFGRLLAEEVLALGSRVRATARNFEEVADLKQSFPDVEHAAMDLNQAQASAK